ncbi:hypothetical protein [Levilactobacillus sp. N40-8-2]|uniref:hypothetical protein n=1 Tax=Levilactobacillus muriae TaxID=3238987 RepID=UPI0038B2E0F2
MITVYVGVSEPNLGSAVGFSKWANLGNGDFETPPGRFKASWQTASQAGGVLPTAFQPKFGER